MKHLSVKSHGKTALGRKTGQAMAEGVAILILIVAVVGLILLIADLGVTIEYKQKLSVVAAQAATYYTTRTTGWNYQLAADQNKQIDINKIVQELAEASGLPPQSVSGTVATIGEVTSVKVTGTNLPLLRGVPALPGFITLDETSAALSSPSPRPTGLLGVSVVGGNGCYVPCYSGLITPGATTGFAGCPNIPGPGSYDQFTLGIPASTGSQLLYTPGTRGPNLNVPNGDSEPQQTHST